jgi:hypothetical protein
MPMKKKGHDTCNAFSVVQGKFESLMGGAESRPTGPEDDRDNTATGEARRKQVSEY